MPTPELIGTAEAASLLGRSQRTVHRLVKAGDLEPALIVPGGHVGIWLFDRADVVKLADERAEKASA